MEKKLRKSGILMHITSLPNKYGWGKFSKEAFEFVDFLKSGNFTVWEVLPFRRLCMAILHTAPILPLP